MRSIILLTTTRLLMPLLLLDSFFLLLRGHNAPGGGFVGGLVAASAFALYALVAGVDQTRKTLRFKPRILMATGLLLALGSGIVGLIRESGFFSAQWIVYKLPLIQHLGTPTVFDIGVYLVVLGATLTILLTLAEG